MVFILFCGILFEGILSQSQKPQLMLESLVPKAKSNDSSHGMENGHNWNELVFSFFIPSLVFQLLALALLLHVMSFGFALLLQDLFLEM